MSIDTEIVTTEPVQAAQETVETPLVQEELVQEDSLVEEISIDGMCGVY